MNPRSLRSAATVLAASAVALTLAPAVATAHGDDGEFEVTVAEPAGDNAIHFELQLTFANDDDPADGATATVVAEDGSGTTVGPIPLEPTGTAGGYAATVQFPSPGDWTVRFTSLTPLAELEITQPVAAPATTTTAPTTTTPTTAVPSTTAPATTPAATTATTTADTAAPVTADTTDAAGDTAGDTSDDGDGPPAALWIALAALVAIVFGGALWWRGRGSRPA